jgi:hypothetical protein
MNRPEPVIRVENLSAGYDETTVILHDINFEVYLAKCSGFSAAPAVARARC